MCPSVPTPRRGQERAPMRRSTHEPPEGGACGLQVARRGGRRVSSACRGQFKVLLEGALHAWWCGAKSEAGMGPVQRGGEGGGDDAPLSLGPLSEGELTLWRVWRRVVPVHRCPRGWGGEAGAALRVRRASTDAQRRRGAQAIVKWPRPFAGAYLSPSPPSSLLHSVSPSVARVDQPHKPCFS